MTLLDKLEKKFHKLSIPNLTIILIIGQIIVFSLNYLKLLPIENIVLIGNKIYEGEFWRLLTFLFIPISNNIIFAVFVWYIYFLYGTALENTWGIFKYNIYVFLSYILTVSISFIIRDISITNAFLYITIFLAFAYLYPNFLLYIFFVIPIKIKWLALITWISYFFILLFGSLLTKILLLVSLGNFLIFFSKDIIKDTISKIKHSKWKMKNQIYNIKSKNAYIHKCYICGITDKDKPEMEFRYCGECDDKCYCSDHLKTHACIK